MKDLKEAEAEVRAQLITPVTYRRFWGHPWYQWRGAVNIPINQISQDEMRKHGLEIGHAKAQTRRRFLNSVYG